MAAPVLDRFLHWRSHLTPQHIQNNAAPSTTKKRSVTHRVFTRIRCSCSLITYVALNDARMPCCLVRRLAGRKRKAIMSAYTVRKRVLPKSWVCWRNRMLMLSVRVMLS
jgi:hypothetical protein